MYTRCFLPWYCINCFTGVQAQYQRKSLWRKIYQSACCEYNLWHDCLKQRVNCNSICCVYNTANLFTVCKTVILQLSTVYKQHSKKHSIVKKYACCATIPAMHYWNLTSTFA